MVWRKRKVASSWVLSQTFRVKSIQTCNSIVLKKHEESYSWEHSNIGRYIATWPSSLSIYDVMIALQFNFFSLLLFQFVLLSNVAQELAPSLVMTGHVYLKTDHQLNGRDHWRIHSERWHRAWFCLDLLQFSSVTLYKSLLPGTMPVPPCITMAISQHFSSRFPEGVQHPVLGTLAPYSAYIENWTYQSGILKHLLPKEILVRVRY